MFQTGYVSPKTERQHCAALQNKQHQLYRHQWTKKYVWWQLRPTIINIKHTQEITILGAQKMLLYFVMLHYGTSSVSGGPQKRMALYVGLLCNELHCVAIYVFIYICGCV